MPVLAACTPLEKLSDHPGYARISITLDTYAHVLPDMQELAVPAIDAALHQASS